MGGKVEVNVGIQPGNQVRRIIQLVKSADTRDIAVDLSDRRKCLPGRPSELTPEIEQAMKEINKAYLERKVRTTRRRMQAALRKKGIKLGLGTVHRYIHALKGRLATWHVNVSITEEQMVKRLEYVAAQAVPGTE
jgi:hypothetical protein